MNTIKTTTASPAGEPSRTVTDLLFRINDPQKRAEVNAFRSSYEAKRGPTDLTKRYTSQWPTKQQQWLFEHEQQRWFDGLPDFARAFFKHKIEAAWSTPQPTGRMPRHLISDYMDGRVVSTEDISRGR